MNRLLLAKRGVALEWMIELCNRQKIDPWFCLPHLADDDFVRNFVSFLQRCAAREMHTVGGW